MSREWQQTRFAEYVMPDAVYYQTIWAVRDLVRMESRLEELNEDRDLSVHSHSLVMDGGATTEISRPTEKYALEKVLPNKMWKYWKQRFLYGVAKNLQLLV